MAQGEQDVAHRTGLASSSASRAPEVEGRGVDQDEATSVGAQGPLPPAVTSAPRPPSAQTPGRTRLTISVPHFPQCTVRLGTILIRDVRVRVIRSAGRNEEKHGRRRRWRRCRRWGRGSRGLRPGRPCGGCCLCARGLNLRIDPQREAPPGAGAAAPGAGLLGPQRQAHPPLALRRTSPAPGGPGWGRRPPAGCRPWGSPTPGRWPRCAPSTYGPR